MTKHKSWLCDWLASYIQPSAEAKTCEPFPKITEKHLKPKSGEYTLDE